ncbi:MAG: peptide chain release factor 2 [Oscillospiraceae bacterium]
MIILDEIKNSLENVLQKINYLKTSIDIDKKKSYIIQLEDETQNQNFWDNIDNSKIVLKKIKDLKHLVDSIQKILNLYEDISDMIDITIETNDEEMAEEIKKSFDNLNKLISLKQIEILLDGEYDKNHAILTLHAGAGGTESQDWVQMIYRMYTKYAQSQGFKIKVLDILDGDEAGIKSISFEVSGFNAYGYLKSENGVHRLVRISPFDSSGRRHTSFASVEVMPDIDEDTTVEINTDDLKIDTFRAGGAGGQHVNKTESAVRVTHLPTGVVVSCQNQRSQHQNKDMCMKMLKSKLVKIKEQENLEKISDIKGVQKDNGWGSQIRSYVFMPYTLVKDHRTNFEKGNVDAVMDGDISEFINEYLKFKNLGKL